MIKKFAFLFVLIIWFCGSNAYSQQQIKNLNGDIIQKGGTKNVYNNKIIIYKEITPANKNKILLISKYIDTTKEIFLNAGIICGTTINLIRNGAQCFGGIPDFISLKLNHNQLLFHLRYIISTVHL